MEPALPPFLLLLVLPGGTHGVSLRSDLLYKVSHESTMTIQARGCQHVRIGGREEVIVSWYRLNGARAELVTVFHGANGRRRLELGFASPFFSFSFFWYILFRM